jgi:hypothetical protein
MNSHAWGYVDPIAKCIVFGGARRNSRAVRGVVEHIHRADDSVTGWPVVREGQEHERRHREVTKRGPKLEIFHGSV